MKHLRWARILVAIVTVVLPHIRALASDNNSVVALREVSNDFDTPVSIVPHPTKNDHVLVAERSGTVVSLNTTNGKTDDILDLEDLINDSSSRGLLGIAARATESENLLFVAYLDPQGDFVVGRFVLSPGKTLNEDSMTVVIKIARLAPNSLGSNLDIAPDGSLFIGTGDGEGSVLKRSHTAQLPRSLLGKAIHISPKNSSGYTIPSDNPFLGDTAYQPEIYAVGFRSPETVRFDATLNKLVLLDSNEVNNEINLVERKRNYGWDLFDGTTCIASDCSIQSTTLPIATLKKPTPESRLVGGITYRGARIPKLHGRLIFAETTTGILYAAQETTTGVWEHREAGTLARAGISALGTDGTGELFIATTTGQIFSLQ